MTCHISCWHFPTSSLIKCFLTLEIFNPLSLPGGASGKELACQGRGWKQWGFDPRVWKIPGRRAQQPTPVSLPGEFHGQRRLMGYSPWRRKEFDTTEVTQHTFTHSLFTHLPHNSPRSRFQLSADLYLLFLLNSNSEVYITQPWHSMKCIIIAVGIYVCPSH